METLLLLFNRPNCVTDNQALNSKFLDYKINSIFMAFDHFNGVTVIFFYRNHVAKIGKK